MNMNMYKESFPMDYCVRSIEEWEVVAKDLLKRAGSVQVWCLEGELGVGKTMFVQALCRQLGVKEPITSPTFSLVQAYSIDKERQVYHFDLYRIQQEEEVLAMGWDHYVASGAYLFVEWPTVCLKFIPLPYLAISIVGVMGNERKVTASWVGV